VNDTNAAWIRTTATILGLISPIASLAWLRQKKWTAIYTAVWLTLSLLIFFFREFLTSPIKELALPCFLIIGSIHIFVLSRNKKEADISSRIVFVLSLLTIPVILLQILVVALFGMGYEFRKMYANSNAPNILEGDYVLVDKHAYDVEPPKRGDLVLFLLPTDTTVEYVKRLVGLPNDRIQMKDGILFLNGEAVKQEIVPEAMKVDLPSGSEGIEQIVETLPDGTNYIILNTDIDGDADNTDEYIVPEGFFFFLGDNRDNSQDSRYPRVGYVDQDNIIGKIEPSR
jgi:signal peptidase I